MALEKKVELIKLRYEKLMNSAVFTDPLQKINEDYIIIDNYIKSIENSTKIKINEVKTDTTALISKLDALSPLKTLIRGYSIVEKDDNIIVKSANLLKSGDIVKMRFADGEKNAKVI